VLFRSTPCVRHTYAEPVLGLPDALPVPVLGRLFKGRLSALRTGYPVRRAPADRLLRGGRAGRLPPRPAPRRPRPPRPAPAPRARGRGGHPASGRGARRAGERRLGLHHVLAEGVEAWGFRVIQAIRQPLSREEVAAAWFRDDYVPVVDALREISWRRCRSPGRTAGRPGRRRRPATTWPRAPLTRTQAAGRATSPPRPRSTAPHAPGTRGTGGGAARPWARSARRGRPAPGRPDRPPAPGRPPRGR
jgi:hypothetical protein